MFRQLARLAEEHELLEAFPFLRGGADDEDDLIQDAIAALPPLVARFFFAPRGGPKAPPLLGRCFTLKKLSAPHDLREACLRGAANSFRFRAEYRWSACAVGFVAGFADGSAWSASWLVAEAACVVLARAPPAVAFPTEDLKTRRAAARKAARRRRLAGRRVCVKNVGAGTLELADGALRLRDDRGNKHAFDAGVDFVLLSPRDAVWQARYVIGALALAAFLAPPAAQRARRWAGLAFIGHAVARRVPRACRERVDATLDGTDDLERTLRDLEYYVISGADVPVETPRRRWWQRGRSASS